MEVLEDHHDGPVRGDRGQPRQDTATNLRDVEAVLLVPGPAHAQRKPEAAHGAVQLVAGNVRTHEVPEPFDDDLLRDVALLSDLSVEHLGDRPERDGLLERARPTREHLRPLGEPGHELVGDAALADTRLAEQRH